MLKKLLLGWGTLSILLVLVFIGIIFLWEKPSGYDKSVEAAVNGEGINKQDNIDIATTEEDFKKQKIEEIKKKELEIEASKPEKIIEKPMLDLNSAELFTELKPLPIEKTFEGVSIKLEKSDKVYPKTTKMTDEIIKRLQSYECYKLTGDGKVSSVYMSFEEMYGKDKSNAEAYAKWFHPAKIDRYRYGKIVWGSSPKLIYTTPQQHTAIRGILKIRYLRSNNPYNLKSDTWYERDTEYWIKNTTDGEFLNKVIYLSNWKEVK